MVEATMILIDNSNYARNGDFQPNRQLAQQEAVISLSKGKLQSHPDNRVGLITMAGQQVTLLNSLTEEMDMITANLSGVEVHSQIHLKKSISIAMLALKHRPNKQLKQKIVVFIASPIDETEQSLVQLAKKLKKNSFGVDIVNIGQQQEQQLNLLKKFIETVNNSDNSSLVDVSPGSNISDAIVSIGSSAKQQNYDFGENNQGAINDDFGIDPNMDPELALALKMSLEEANAQQQQQQQQAPLEEPMEKIEEEQDLSEEQLLKLAEQMSLQPQAEVPNEQKKMEEEILEDKNFEEELLQSLLKKGEKKDEDK